MEENNMPHETDCRAQVKVTETWNIYDITTAQFTLFQQPV